MITSESLGLIDVFTDGDPESDMNASVLGQISSIDDILISSRSWEYFYRKVKRLLDV